MTSVTLQILAAQQNVAPQVDTGKPQISPLGTAPVSDQPAVATPMSRVERLELAVLRRPGGEMSYWPYYSDGCLHEWVVMTDHAPHYSRCLKCGKIK